ncbi:hypothetical protein M0805_008897 [Coniferiporia weirii]|nr:hypothetical protein M0805_008897 [Coniferiporia weirii]
MAIAVKDAWVVPYAGNTHRLLHKTINTMNATRRGKSDSNCLHIVQSSGTGKSRAVHELGKLVFTIPFNVRSGAENRGFAYPYPDGTIRDFLVKAPSDPQKARLYFVKFLHGLFTAVLEEIEKLSCVNTLEEVATAWSEYLEGDGVRSELYQKVIKVVQREENVRRQVGRTTETSPVVENVDESVSIDKQTKEKVRMLISRIDQLASGCSSAPGNVRIVIYFDEAHQLGLSHYYALLSAAYAVINEPVFFLLLSTDCSFSKYFPTEPVHPSAWILPRGLGIQPPFTELPFDCLCNEESFIRSGTMSLDEVNTVDFMCLFGRPLFWSLHKLDWDAVDAFSDAALAVLAVRLLLDFNLTREWSCRTTIRLVQSHMAVVYSITADRKLLKAGYPSEPILAEAAAQQMRTMRSDLTTSFSRLLFNYMNEGLINSGKCHKRGELVARLIFILAYDKAADMYKGGGRMEHYLFYSNAVPVNLFIQALFGEKNAEGILKSLPDNVPSGVTFEEAFSDAWVRFTHFQWADSPYVLSTEGAWAAVARGMAFQCGPDEDMVNIFIPVVLGKESKLCESCMSGILVHVRTQIGSGHGARVDIDERYNGFFPEQSGRDGRPYITIDMELGTHYSRREQAKDTPVATVAPGGEQDSSTSATTSVGEVDPINTEVMEHPRYAIFARGCSESVFGVVDNKNFYAELLVPGSIFREPFRQTDEALSAVRGFKLPFWTLESFDWAGGLSVEECSEGATEGVYTNGAV